MFYKIKINNRLFISASAVPSDANFSTHFTRFIHYFFVF